MRKVQRRRRGPELTTLQSLNNCNVEPRATRAYGDLRTKICERTFFLRVRVKEARTLAGQKVRTNRPFATYWTSIDRARNVPILASRPSSSPLDFLGSRQFCVSRLQKIEISFLEFFTRRVLAF